MIDEEGTETAAATAIVAFGAGADWEPPSPIPFVVDRPSTCSFGTNAPALFSFRAV